MNFLETPHKKKSAILTFLIGVLIILFFYFIGMKYYDPPIVYGMEVSFGNTTENFGEEIYLHEPYFKGSKAYDYLKECIDTGWVSSSGLWVSKFENQLKEFTGAKYVI